MIDAGGVSWVGLDSLLPAPPRGKLIHLAYTAVYGSLTRAHGQLP